jgi:hypothetical protein
VSGYVLLKAVKICIVVKTNETGCIYVVCLLNVKACLQNGRVQYHKQNLSIDVFDFDGTVHEESMPQGLVALTFTQLFYSVDG